MKITEFYVDSLTASKKLAADLGSFLRVGDIVAFKGDLGAGKTEFCRALIHSVGYQEDVPSPTFNLVQIYEPDIDDFETPVIWHLDLYRLEQPEEIFELGIEEAFDSAISLIEWPDRMGTYLPKGYLLVELSMGKKNEERMICFYGDEYWSKRLKGLTS